MPVHDGSGSNQDERLPPPRPERSQRNPEQLVQGSQSSARPLCVQSEQLPTESQVFEDEVLAGAKRADDPPEARGDAGATQSWQEYYRNYPNSAFLPSHSFCRCTTFWRGSGAVVAMRRFPTERLQICFKTDLLVQCRPPGTYKLSRLGNVPGF